MARRPSAIMTAADKKTQIKSLRDKIKDARGRIKDLNTDLKEFKSKLVPINKSIRGLESEKKKALREIEKTNAAIEKLR